jgi:hypothetical protein
METDRWIPLSFVGLLDVKPLSIWVPRTYALPPLIQYGVLPDCWEGLFKHHSTVLRSVQTNARAIWRASPEPPALSRILILVVFENLLLVIRCTFVRCFNYRPCAVINTLWLCYIERLVSVFDFEFARSRVYWDLVLFFAMYLRLCTCVWYFRYWTAVVVALPAIFSQFIHTEQMKSRRTDFHKI